MPKSTAFANDLVKLIFNGTTIANLADNAASSPATSLSVALHTADPTAAGTQSSNKASYGGPYARIAVARPAGWTVSGSTGTVSPAAPITFAACTSGSAVVTHFSIGSSTRMLYSGTVSPSITVNTGVTPILTAASTVTEA